MGFWVATTIKALIQLVGVPVHGDLVLFHAFQERRLGFCRGAVDLVADDDVGEHGARPEFELP